MRLIDADAFKKYICNAYEQVKHMYPDGGKWAKEITEDFCKDIDEQPTIEPQKWMPCSERLPVICEYDANGQKTFSCRVLSTQVYGNGLVFVGSDRYISDRGWLSEVLDENGVPASKVIAWMPLPEPWGGDSDE